MVPHALENTGKRLSCAIAAVLLTLASAAADQTPSKGSTSPAAAGATRKDIFFLVDVTGSMVGQPPGSANKDILARILRRVVEHIDFHCDDGDRLFVATFQDTLHDLDGAGPRFEAIRRFDMRRQLTDARDYVLSIDSGTRDDKGAVPVTGIYDSVSQIFRVMRSAAQEATRGPGGAADYSQRLVLFTDGEENVRPLGLPDMLREHRLLREESGLGDRVFFRMLFYGGKGPDIRPETGIDARTADPDATLPEQVRIQPTAIDLGDIQGLTERAIALDVVPPNTRLERLRVSIRSQEQAGLAGLLSIGPDAAVTGGRAELRFTFGAPEAAERILRETGKAVDYRADLTLQSDDERYVVEPRVIPVTASYSGTREITIVLATTAARLDEIRGGKPLARVRSTESTTGFLDARFSALAARDEVDASLTARPGFVLPSPARLVVGELPSVEGTVKIGAGQHRLGLRLPAVACMANGLAVYDLAVSVPAGVTLRVLTSDGKVVPPAADGRSVSLPVAIEASDYPPCEPPRPIPWWVWALGVFGLLAVAAFVLLLLNRPHRAVRLEGQGLMPHRLRKAQGFFSRWVTVGRDGDLKHTALPGKAFRIRATRFGGVKLCPQIDGVRVGLRECAKGKTVTLSKGSVVNVAGASMTLIA